MNERENRLRPGPRPSVPGTLACLLFGPILWAVQFTVVYASHTLVCSQGGSAPAGHGIVIGTSVALAAAIIAFLLLPERFARGLGLPPGMDSRSTYLRIARVGAVLGLVAIVWTGLTAVIVDACAQAR